MAKNMALNDSFVCMSTGRLVSTKICTHSSSVYVLGEKAYHIFKEKIIEIDESTLKFHDRIPKVKLKTFPDMTDKVNIKSQGKDIVLLADRSLFKQMVLAAKAVH